ncbi:cyclin-domain-containing protein [Hortaea werneckii]|nr:cyclin-domain-containing protein [Hortaea werneckii]OTA35322.1 hypothetical protein BTJ68_04286 [Hortaea werneckii EXF-2000]KAI6809118.1 cyclin-domain-containing protein [Hortaea werneckii]KAI6926128.1 cyclin-domain-containing protein [Hortaea werneckii]KAI6929792.1 cyclin-domain-containing protein [Hortaea werneckii]
MGSIVADAVNSFFGHSPSHTTYPYHEAAPPSTTAQHSSPRPKRNQTPSRSDTPMSASNQWASGSTGTSTQHAPAAPQAPRAPSNHQTVADPTPRPASPPLAANTEPPPESLQPAATQSNAADTPADARHTRTRKIKVRDLEQIQSFATEDMGAFSEIGSRSRSRSRGGAAEDSPQYEISDMKVEHIIEMVAGLLTKITTTNDQQHEHLHRQPAHLENTSHLTSQTSSVLAFHGKNVPSITILSYLSRINKYCPTSYEVFLSLLVYFDRMTERVNAGPMQTLREANQHAYDQNRSASSSSESISSDEMEGVTTSTGGGVQTATPPASGGMEKPAQRDVPGTPHSRPQRMDSPGIPPEPAVMDPYNLSHFFVVDSFNIHRLVIAGVTCASKFFSDIFYTNSRYAKVGGLPLQELNHLELQFLLLNDFRLSVPVEEIEAYGTMLVEFYAREVVAQKQQEAQAMTGRSFSESSSDSTATVRAA